MKSLVGTVTLSLLLHSSRGIRTKKEQYTNTLADEVANKDAMLYSSSISSGNKLREMDTATKEKIEAASEAVQSPYFMAQDQHEILEQTLTNDHLLVQQDSFKKDPEAPGEDFYELVMIDSI